MLNIAPPTELLATALRACRRHFIAVAAFSALLNLLFLVPMLYMLQIYDRVIPTRGELTLFFLTLVLLFGLTTLALLDFVRSRLLVRASIRLDRQLAGMLLDTSLARRDKTFDAVARQSMRELDTLRQALTGPAVIALCDAPWSRSTSSYVWSFTRLSGCWCWWERCCWVSLHIVTSKRPESP